MVDGFGREIDYLRISVTDRCNLRCNYCQPNGICKVAMSQIMTYEQIVQTCKVAVKLGITKFKITGGEPLVRKGVCNLVKMIKEIPGVEQVTLTTNGILLSQYLPELIKAGIDAINISLDTLDKDTFAQITGFDGLSLVLKSVEDCLKAGVKTKLNCVLQKEINDTAYVDLLEYVKNKKVDLRFIELMPIGFGKAADGVNNQHLLKAIKNLYGTVIFDTSKHGNGPAVYVKLPGFEGSVGFISAMNGKFCSSCNRLRLTTTGDLKACLCYDKNRNVMNCFNAADEAMQNAALERAFINAIGDKAESHHFEDEVLVTESRVMAQIGG